MSFAPDLAVVAAGCAIVAQTVAAVAANFNAKAERAKLQSTLNETHRIVQGNGRGDISVMLDSLLAWQEDHDVVHDRLDARIKARTRRVSAQSHRPT